MPILLTNDDGIDAPGLTALHESISQFLRVRGVADPATELFVVAPDRCRSECGHGVTTGRPLHVEEVRPGWFAVDGTPVDCVRVALAVICPSASAVLSGINAGANVGVDLLVSGTFAAAREAAIQDRPAMAVSHYRRPEIAKTWDHTGDWLAPVWERFWREAIGGVVSAPAPLWNVNLPAIDSTGRRPPVVVCPVETLPMVRDGQVDAPEHADSGRRRVHLKSEFHGRPRTPGSDVDQCFGGKLTISILRPHLG